VPVKVSGTWRTTSSTNVKVGGTWKATQSGWVRLSGVWREFVANTLSLGYASTAFTVGNSAENKSPTVSGGYTTQAKAFALVSGALPSGVTLNASSGVLTGPNTWNFPAVQNTGTTSAEIYGLTIASDGGVIITGRFGVNPIIFGSITLPYASSNEMFVAKLSNSGVWVWASAGSGDSATPGSIVSTSDGGAIVAGTFNSGDTTFGSFTLPIAGYSATLFVAKISSSGSWSWALGNTGTGDIKNIGDIGLNVANDGSVIVTGAFETDDITIGSTTLPLSDPSGNFFVAKANASGSWLWAISSLNASIFFRPSSVLLGTDVYVCGTFTSANLTVGTVTVPIANTGGTFFVLKVNNSGTVVWGNRNTGTGICNDDLVAQSAYDESGIWITGSFRTASITFSSTLAIAGTFGTLCIAKINTSGSWVSSFANTGTGVVGAPNIVSTPDSGVIVVGYFQTASITFGSTTLAKTGGASNLFVTKLSSTGTLLWATSNTGTGNIRTTAPRLIATAESGAIVHSTFATASVTFGSITLPIANTSATNFVSKVSNSGTWNWAIANTGTGRASFFSYMEKTSDNGAIILSGVNTASIVFGSTTLTRSGGDILAVVRIAPNGTFGTSSQTPLGFPSTVTISATDTSGSATTSPTISAV
jgi:hypothetical protein